MRGSGPKLRESVAATDGSGRATVVHGSVTDVTEFKQVEDLVRRYGAALPAEEAGGDDGGGDLVVAPEDALVAFAAPLGLAILYLQQLADSQVEAPRPLKATPDAGGKPVPVRHFRADHSIFIGEEYLIKGVAGAIFAKLLRACSEEGRTEFTNRELRLDASLRLPDLGDNLEARLILLQRRLAERSAFLRLEKTGRGRFRLVADRAFSLSEL